MNNRSPQKHWIVQDNKIGTAHLSRNGQWVDFYPASINVEFGRLVISPHRGVAVPPISLEGVVEREERLQYRCEDFDVMGIYIVAVTVAFFGRVELSNPAFVSNTPETNAFLAAKYERDRRERNEKLLAHAAKMRAQRQLDFDQHTQMIKKEWEREEETVVGILNLAPNEIVAYVERLIRTPGGQRRIRRWLRAPRYRKCPLFETHVRISHFSTESQRQYEMLVDTVAEFLPAALEVLARELAAKRTERLAAWRERHPE